ncbi:MAG: hypothetical protein K2X43_01330 [Hyphomonadaceae bacterium]|nr:hypothetical protein [Hyphomonadaceae bacterium]
MKHIVYTAPDGTVQLCTPYHGDRRLDETEASWYARIANKDVPSGSVNIQVIDSSALPSVNFRNAWRQDGQRLVIDMPKAREIHRASMRQARAPLLQQLDIEYQRADEAGDAERKKEIAARKQALRDCTKHPDIEAAQTPEELSAVWPELPERPAPQVWDEPVPPEAIPPFLPLPDAQPTGTREFSLQELLKNAEAEGGPIEVPPLPPPEQSVIPPPLPPVPVEDALSEAARRRAAKATVRKAVANVMKLTSDQQFKYEQALLVRNKNVDAMSDMKMLAAIDGVTVQELADRIINEHEARRRRGSYVWAAEAQALKDIDNALGDDIDEVARKAAAEILGDDAQ